MVRCATVASARTPQVRPGSLGEWAENEGTRGGLRRGAFMAERDGWASVRRWLRYRDAAGESGEAISELCGWRDVPRISVCRCRKGP